ncbi:hypothetical protein J8I26_12205 [Herbaspirillum sp. LeCh32-8]|uniref:hypothetical protein n=1 Tax=Herbaspirillum sp. LeCh32-8 TaxID=2821356 RepID=UPI001AE4ECD8|nr:hypothetical protein [Herbaspirillum sp. LeCh32-8]MBP0598874.1 hypothetical protein [Herbaspirillum sp. LeCh32-8]
MAAYSYLPKLQLAPTKFPPDSFSASGPLSRPPNDHVISRNIDGSILSTYGDDSWDFTPYTSRKLKIYFANWCKHHASNVKRELVEEIKWFIFVSIWKNLGMPYAFSTIEKHARQLALIATYASLRKVRVSDVLSKPILLGDYLSTVVSTKAVGDTLAMLRQVDPVDSGCEIVNGKTFERMKKGLGKDREVLQHPPIPTAIYSRILEFLESEIQSFEGVVDRLLMFSSDAISIFPDEEISFKDSHTPVTSKSSNARAREIAALAEKHGLTKYFEGRGVKYLYNVASLIRQMQCVCKIAVLAYSGMRNGETRTLAHDCLKNAEVEGKFVYEILGKTTKFNNGRPYHVRWVTSPEGARAISLARKICLWLWRYVSAADKSKKKYIPLFLTSSHIPFSKFPQRDDISFDGQSAADMTTAEAKNVLKAIDITLTEEDVCELEFIDPHRAWRTEEKFTIGQAWNVTYHQFRRSLALYSSASGLVSFSTLRRQLKHITAAMSHYYARGSQYVTELLHNFKEHFAAFYQESQDESQMLSYTAHVLFSPQKMHGAHGAHVEALKKKGLLPSRESTLSMIKKGELAYKETPLGGCTETGTCTKRAFRSVISCLDCTRAAISSPKLERHIRAKVKGLGELVSQSVMWRMESAELAILQNFYNRIMRA